MSFGYDQTQVNRQRIWIIVLVIVLVAVLITGGIFISSRLFNTNETGNAFLSAKAVTATWPVDPSNTPVPTEKMTALPTYTTVPTLTATEVPTITLTNTPQPDPDATPVFLYDVDEVLYLNSSINVGRYWNPGLSTPVVPANEQAAIRDVVWKSHLQRVDIWKNEVYPDFSALNSGEAINQLKRYYDGHIFPDDGCTVKIEIVDQKFHTTIIYYNAETGFSRTMTMKVESRSHTCENGSSWVNANDGYAYENQLQKINGVWKIIEHPAAIGQ